MLCGCARSGEVTTTGIPIRTPHGSVEVPRRSRENHSSCGGKCGGKIRPKWKRTYGFHRKSLIFLVGARGFEPPTTCTP